MDIDEIEYLDKKQLIAICVFSPIIIVISIYLLVDSMKTIKTIYYQIINPTFSILIFILIIIKEVINLISDFYLYFEKDPGINQRVIFNILDLMFVRNFINISIFTRIISIKNELIAYKNKLIYYSIDQQRKNIEPLLRKNRESDNYKNFLSYKFFIIQICCLVILIFVCIIPIDDSIIISYFKKIAPVSKQPKVDKNLHIAGGIFILLFNNLLFLFGLIPLIKIMKLRIKEDNFYLKIEFYLLLGIIFLENNLSYFLGLFLHHQQKLNVYYFFGFSEMIYNLCKITSLLLIYIFRKNFTVKKGINTDKISFEEFLMNNNCFQVFKNYIKINQDNLNYLAFHLDYINFIAFVEKKKKSLPKDNRSFATESYKDSSDIKYDMPDEETIEKATDIFITYFKSNNESSLQNSSGNAMSPSGSYEYSNNYELDLSSNYLNIMFPPDIYEDVNAAAKANFVVEKLDTVFDEAYKWIIDKLTTTFKMFKVDKEEQKKIQTILFFDEYFHDDYFEQMTDEQKLAIDNPIIERMFPSTINGNNSVH